jgi:serine/threonine protein kinase
MLTSHGRSVYYSFSLTWTLLYICVGTPGYVAPEILTAGSRVGYGNKVDVFSAGVTLYVMLCGYEPFYGETEKELIEANKKADIEFPTDWKLVSDDARDLVLKMTKADPSERLSAKEALQHPWMARWTGDDLGASSGSHSGTKNMALNAADLPAEGACIIS